MELEKLYPLVYFERNMCDFIQMLLEDMDIPALDKVNQLLWNSLTKASKILISHEKNFFLYSVTIIIYLI